MQIADDKISMSTTSDFNDIDTYIPRDAVSILNELKPGLTYTLVQSLDGNMYGSVEVDGKTYHGNGKSQMTAKQSVAEAVLKDLFFDMIYATMTGSDEIESLYNTNSWKLLGSLAMFKLLEDWLLFYVAEKTNTNNHEVHTPEVISSSESSLNSESSELKISNHLKIDKKIPPPDANPIVTLNTLLGMDLKFVDLKVNNNKPPFTFSLTVDNIEYVGKPAGNKKDAKHNVARQVLIKKYGYDFKQ